MSIKVSAQKYCDQACYCGGKNVKMFCLINQIIELINSERTAPPDIYKSLIQDIFLYYALSNDEIKFLMEKHPELSNLIETIMLLK